MAQSFDIVGRFMTRQYLPWVHPEAMREAVLNFIPLSAESIQAGTWPPLNSQFFVDPTAGAFAIAAPPSRLESGFHSITAFTTGINKEDMVWYQVVLGISVCTRLWLDHAPRDAMGNHVPVEQLKVLDLDVLWSGWNEIRPQSNWTFPKARRLTSEEMAGAMADLVRGLPVVPLRNCPGVQRVNVHLWTRLVYSQWRLYRPSKPGASLALGPSVILENGDEDTSSPPPYHP